MTEEQRLENEDWERFYADPAVGEETSMAKTHAQTDPRKVGGRYFCGYWRHEYRVDAISTRDGAVLWFDVTWIPTEDATHPRASAQWRGDGYHKTRHCTTWDARRDEIVSEP